MRSISTAKRFKFKKFKPPKITLKQFSKIMLTLGISACMVIILIRPDVYVASALEGVKLWALVVLPSLLPFFFFTSLLAKIGATERMARTLTKPCRKIFGTSGYAAYALLMSILSGYTVGAKIIGDLGENRLIDETHVRSAFHRRERRRGNVRLCRCRQIAVYRSRVFRVNHGVDFQIFRSG